MSIDTDSEIDRFENATLHEDDLIELWAQCNDPYNSEERFRASFNFDELNDLRLLTGMEERALEPDEDADLFLWLSSGDGTDTIKLKFEDAVSEYLNYFRNAGEYY